VTARLNCSAGLFKSGDHVIVSSLEHNAVMRPLRISGNGVEFSAFRNATLDDAGPRAAPAPEYKLVL
jgi:selenocysteine lyase/cysteine desulfurase